MAVSELLQDFEICKGNTVYPLPGWIRFLAELGAYAYSNSGLYCCVTVPDAPHASLFVAWGAFLASKETTPEVRLRPGQPVYVKDPAWITGIKIDDDIPGQFKFKVHNNQTISVPAEEAFERIKLVEWNKKKGSWLSKNYKDPLKSCLHEPLKDKGKAPIDTEQAVLIKVPKWFRGINSESSSPDSLRIEQDVGSSAATIVPLKDVSDRIRPALWEGSLDEWLKDSRRAVSKSNEIEFIESHNTSVIASIHGSSNALFHANGLQCLKGEGAVQSLSSWLMLQGSTGVAERVFNVRVNDTSHGAGLNIYSDSVPIDSPETSASTVCCLDARNGTLEDKAQLYIRHFIREGGNPITREQGFPFARGKDLDPLLTGLGFCGVMYG